MSVASKTRVVPQDHSFVSFPYRSQVKRLIAQRGAFDDVYARETRYLFPNLSVKIRVDYHYVLLVAL